VPKDGTGHKAGFQGVKSRLGALRPYKLDVLLEESGERSGDLGVIFYEAAVEVGEAEETLNVEDGLGSTP
jgi:hypothetical protein